MSAEQFRNESGYEIDGVWYPRVTKIVDIKSKPALYKFYAEMESFDHGRRVVENSAVEGTLIHELAQKIILGETLLSIPSSVAPAISAFADFFAKNPIRSHKDFVEKRVCDEEHRYAGTIDALASINGKIGVLDIKTSQAIYRDYNLQTAAYIKILREKFNGVSTRWILRIDQTRICSRCSATLRSKGGRDKVRKPFFSSAPACPNNEHNWSEPKGKVELKEFPLWEEDFKGFLGAKSLWEWENAPMLKQIGYIR